MGGGPSECSGAGGYARHGLLVQVCPQNIVLLQIKGGAVHMLVPEYILAWAIRQRLVVRRIVKENGM
jgi:hypothetical protein